MHPRLRAPLVFLLLLAGSFLTYYYGIADTPRRDHGGYLAERVLMETDWDWFWHSVSYSRTRFLYPGDYYLFRPLHMAVLALKDIFFRSNLFALGAINITMMAVAAFSLYLFSSKLLKPTTAFILALLFMVQHAGLEMVAWGHISSYLLALAFFGFAMTALLEAGPGNKAALKKAGAFLLLGTLVHEMVVVALVLAAPFLLFIRWRTGKGAALGGIPLRSYILWVIAVPVLVYLGLDLFDYLYHGAPPLLSTGGDSVSGGKYGPLGAIFTVAGTSAIAFLAPFKIKLVQGTHGTLAWNFGSMRPAIVAAGAVLSLATVAGLYRSIRAMKTGSGSGLALAAFLVLILFAGIVLGLGLGRVHSRGESYLYEATYYYSITAYIFCLILAIGINRLSRARKNMIALFLSRAILVAMLLLVAVNFTKTREALGRDWHFDNALARMCLALDEALSAHSQHYCLAGIVPGHIALYEGLLPQLFREYQCQKEDKRAPGYIVRAAGGSLWLAELEKKPIGAFGEPQEVRFERPKPDFLLSLESFDKPDIALTVHNRLRTFLLFGYESINDSLYVELNGPLLYCKIVTGGETRFLMRHVALPYAASSQRLEVRHFADFIYVFVDGYLVAVTSDSGERPGRIALHIRTSGNIEQAYSDFVVAPSAPKGEELLTFKPVARLIEKPDIAFPTDSH